MPKRSEVERLLVIGITGIRGRAAEDKPINVEGLRAYIRAAERMRGVISADDSASVPAIASTARAYDRAKRRILGGN